MSLYRPDQLLESLSDLVASISAHDSYKQVTADAWNKAYEPFAPDMIPEDIAGLKHLMFYLDLREIGPVHIDNSGVRLRATLDAYAMFAIRTRGENADGVGAAVVSFRQALLGTRHLWYTLARADERINGITTLVEEGLTAYRVIPTSLDWHMGHVRIQIIFTDSLGA